MTAATAKAKGTRDERNAAKGRVRISFTIPDRVFDDLKRTAITNHRSIAEEIRRRVAPAKREGGS